MKGGRVARSAAGAGAGAVATGGVFSCRRSRHLSSPRTCCQLSSWTSRPDISRRSSSNNNNSITSRNRNNRKVTSSWDPNKNTSRDDNDVIPPEIAVLVQDYANRQETKRSLQELHQTGKTENHIHMGRLGRRLASERILMDYAQLLKEELPIRLAHRIQDLDQLPQMRDMPSVQHVKGIYIHSFMELLKAPNPTSPVLEASFAELLRELYQNHSQVLLKMAQGAWEFKQQQPELMARPSLLQTSQQQQQQQQRQHQQIETSSLWFAQHDECQAFLDRFYMSRVGIRVLAGQYLALRQQLLSDSTDSDNNNNNNKSDNYVGMICSHTSACDVVRNAIRDATRLCVDKFGDAPHVEIQGRLDLTFCYIPTHLHYILLELLKNAMRATMEQHNHHTIQSSSRVYAGGRSSTTRPDVKVIIADGMDQEDVIIKVMDQGGGIPRSQIRHIWSYLFTTADVNIQNHAFLGGPSGYETKSALVAAGGGPILAGFGFGLPMSRTYARYFGGDLDLISMEGYGTDAYCHLARLGGDDSDDDSLSSPRRTKNPLKI